MIASQATFIFDTSAFYPVISQRYARSPQASAGDDRYGEQGRKAGDSGDGLARLAVGKAGEAGPPEGAAAPPAPSKAGETGPPEGATRLTIRPLRRARPARPALRRETSKSSRSSLQGRRGRRAQSGARLRAGRKGEAGETGALEGDVDGSSQSLRPRPARPPCTERRPVEGRRKGEAGETGAPEGGTVTVSACEAGEAGPPEGGRGGAASKAGKPPVRERANRAREVGETKKGKPCLI